LKKSSKNFNNKMLSADCGLWIEDRNALISQNNIIATPRIGIDYAGQIWREKPYRFVLSSTNYTENTITPLQQ